jgi:hypothetical protein
MNPMMQAIVGSGLGSITMPLEYGRIRQLDSRVMSLLSASATLCPLDLSLNLHSRVGWSLACLGYQWAMHEYMYYGYSMSEIEIRSGPN